MIHHYEKEVYKKVKWRLPKAEQQMDVEEVVNDIFLKLHDELQYWNGIEPYEPKLNLHMKRAIIDHYRKFSEANYIKLDDGTKLFRHVPLDNTNLSAEDTEKLIIEVEIQELREAVAPVIDKVLGAKQAEVIKRTMNGESDKEIADAMNTTAANVHSHRGKAMKKLRKDKTLRDMLSAFVFLGDGFNFENIGVAEAAAGATTTAATTTATTTATTVSHTGIGAAIMGLGAGAKAGIAIAAAVVITGGVAVPVYIHNENQKAEQAAIIEQQEQERAASEAAEAARIAEEQAQAEREAEAARIAAEKAELERKAAEGKAEAERLAAEQAEAERIAAEEKAAAEKAEQKRLAAEEKAARQAAAQQPLPLQAALRHLRRLPVLRKRLHHQAVVAIHLMVASHFPLTLMAELATAKDIKAIQMVVKSEVNN